MILIGSRAAKLRLGAAFSRPCVDFDFICTLPEYHQWMEKNSAKINPIETYEMPEFHKQIVKGQNTICEFEIVQPGSSNELLVNLMKREADAIETPFGICPPIDVLYTIKASHRFKKFQNSATGWFKTLNDYHLMRNMGAKIRPEYEVFLKLREKETYTYAHPKLNMDKAGFFRDDFYVFQHDDLHVAIAAFNKPAYQFFQADNAEVACDMKKFWTLPREIQLASVCEEACVLALERALIGSFDKWRCPRDAWFFALAKTLSSITSGKWRSWGYDNVADVIRIFNGKYIDFYEKFQEGVKSGKVRYIEGYEQKEKGSR